MPTESLAWRCALDIAGSIPAEIDVIFSGAANLRVWLPLEKFKAVGTESQWQLRHWQDPTHRYVSVATFLGIWAHSLVSQKLTTFSNTNETMHKVFSAIYGQKFEHFLTSYRWSSIRVDLYFWGEVFLLHRATVHWGLPPDLCLHAHTCPKTCAYSVEYYSR